MTPRLLSAVPAGRYTIRLEYADGTRAVIDLSAELWGPMFEPLRDPETFRSFRLDEDLRTIVWPNGADLAPEFLYERATA